MAIYYNDNDPSAVEWLQELMKEKRIPQGEIDNRDIRHVRPEEINHFTQCHFFAGIGGWTYALELAGWPEDRPVWTGSCPCQPFSTAGRRKGTADERHLWPAFKWLIEQCQPSVVFGEQVASKIGRVWLTGIFTDLEALGYWTGAADLCLRASVPRTSGKDSTGLLKGGWVTPNARDWKDTPGQRIYSKNPDGSTRKRLDQLPRQAAIAQPAGWITPQCSDARNLAIPRNLRFKGNAPSEANNNRSLLKTGSYRGDLKDWAYHAGMTQSGFPVVTEKRGALNPELCRWLMGFPEGWTALKATAMP